MFDDSAIRISAARARTGILTFLIQASKIEGTIRACYAFRATRGWTTDENR